MWSKIVLLEVLMKPISGNMYGPPIPKFKPPEKDIAK